MKFLPIIPIFFKAIIIAILLIQIVTLLLCIVLNDNLYLSPFPYFMTAISLFVVSLIVGDDFNEIN